MNKTKYTNYDDLPLMLSVPDVASVLGISLAGAYELVRSDGFPSLRIGSRIVVPKEKFIGKREHQCLKTAPQYTKKKLRKVSIAISGELWYLCLLRKR